MNLKRAVYHVKHPVVDKVTPWFAYAGYLHEKGTGKTTMNLENYVMDALSSFYDGEGNPLLSWPLQMCDIALTFPNFQRRFWGIDYGKENTLHCKGRTTSTTR